MPRFLLALLALTAFLASPVRAGDPPPAPPPDTRVEDARTKLLGVLLDEAKVEERTKAVAELAALDKTPAAKALLDALVKLATRTAQVEVNAARTRQDYQPYKGAAQATDAEWGMKLRLLQQMEHEDLILRGDGAVLESFGAGVAAMKDKEALGFLDRAAVKAEAVIVRRLLDAALLRNPTTNAAELMKRGFADPDLTVRVAVVDACAFRKEPAVIAFAIKTLADTNWIFRQSAARALAVIGDVKGIAPIIAAMMTEDGRLLDDYGEALAKLTGTPLGPNPDAWRKWWEEHKAELAGKGAGPAPPMPKLAKLNTEQSVVYYGIQTHSKKVVFIIDCSGSMNEEIGKGEVTGGGADFVGKKVDVAKRMLKQAVTRLDPSTWFNVVTYNSEARPMFDKLVQASPEVKFQTNQKIDELGARGGTYTYGALKAAFFGLAEPGVTTTSPPYDTIFLLSDGQPTEVTIEDAVEAKPMEPEKILQSVAVWNPFRAVRIHAIAIDPRLVAKTGANFVRFMRDLAEQNRGEYVAIGSK